MDWVNGIAVKESSYNLETIRVLPLPKYVTEFVGDEDRLAIPCEAQRGRPFGEIPGIPLEGQLRAGECMREDEPLAAKFRPVQLPHFKFLVFSDRDDVLKICVDC